MMYFRAFSIPKESGVAMVVALLMSALLSLLALQITLTSRGNSRVALEAQVRSDNLITISTKEAEMIFALLTERWVSEQKNNLNVWPRSWNFSGVPFEVFGSTITIQDESGLLPMPQPGDSVESLSQVLFEAGVKPDRARQIARVLQGLHYDFRDGERRRIPLQSLYELTDLADLAADEVGVLARMTTLFPSSHFNPDTAPDAVVKALLRHKDVDTLLRLRADQATYQSAYAQELAAIGDELVVPVAGPALRWSIYSTLRGQSYSRRGTIVIRPYSVEPVVVWSYSRLGG